MAQRATAIYLEGTRDLLRALRHIPERLEGQVRDASLSIAERAAAETRSAASTRAERKAAKSIRARRDRLPTVAAGGGTRTEGGPMWFGTEFGGRARDTTLQFRPHLGTRGYWFYPTVRSRGRDWAGEWLDGIDIALRAWRN